MNYRVCGDDLMSYTTVEEDTPLIENGCQRNTGDQTLDEGSRDESTEDHAVSDSEYQGSID